jgi:hypothetical protein
VESSPVPRKAAAAKMGNDKIDWMHKSSTDYIVSSDMSCLMHLLTVVFWAAHQDGARQALASSL